MLSGVDRSSKWYVPVTFTTSADINGFETTTPEGWLTPDEDLTVLLPENADWLILNNYEIGNNDINLDRNIYELSILLSHIPKIIFTSYWFLEKKVV